jgi:hypothetical protein
MLTFIDASKILGLCQIPTDIQNKILLLFIGFGSPTSRIIKQQLEYSDTSFNDSLFERIILENDVNTLWRLKVFLNGGITFVPSCIKNLRPKYELEIAYLTNGSCDWEKFASIYNLLEAIKTYSNYQLFMMFYNLDKNGYTYLGTPTANIIHNAIEDEILYEVNHVIWNDSDSDSDDY